MKKQNYRLILGFPIKAFDHLEARQKMKQFLEDHGIKDDVEMKLQRIFENKPPEGVEI